MPQNLSGETAQVRLSANEVTPSLKGATGIAGTVGANATVPAITGLGGIVSAASFAVNTPVAPGGFVTIFNANLADAGTIGGPVNVTVPSGIVAGASVPLTLWAGNLISTPVTVAIQ